MLDVCFVFLDQKWQFLAVLNLYFDCASIFYVSIFSAYVSIFSAKNVHILTARDLVDVGFEFLEQNWINYDNVWRMFRLSRPKMDIIRLCSTIFSNFSTFLALSNLFFDFLGQNGHTSTVLDLCFNTARLMFWLSRSKLCMFRVCSNFVSTELDKYFDCARRMFRLYFFVNFGYVLIVFDLFFHILNQIGYVSTILEVCSDFLDQSWAYYKCVQLFFRLCLTYVLTFWAKNKHILTVLDLVCDYCRRMFRFSRSKLGMFGLSSTFVSMCSTNVLIVLDLLFVFRGQKWAYFDYAEPMFWLCSTYVLTFLMTIGHFSTVFEVC